MKVYQLGLVGESNYQAAIAGCGEGEAVRFHLEPSNPHDARAIAVVGADGATIGYIGRDSWLHRAVHEEGRGVSGTIRSIGTGGKGLLGVVLDVTLTDDELAVREYEGEAAPTRKSSIPIELADGDVVKHITEVLRSANAPGLCSCREAFEVPLLGLAPGFEVACPRCKERIIFDDETVDRLDHEFETAIRRFYIANGAVPPARARIRSIRRSAGQSPSPRKSGSGGSGFLTGLFRSLRR